MSINVLQRVDALAEEHLPLSLHTHTFDVSIKLQEMENRITFLMYKITTIAAMVVTTSLCTCTEEEIHTSVVRFDKETQNITEGSDTQIILVLDKPAHHACSVKIKLETNAVYGDHFISTPEVEEDGTFVVNIAKGESSASFNVTSIDNSLFDHGKFILFTLRKPAEGLVLGSTTTSIIIVDDDEGPSVVNFDYARMIIGENESFVIDIPLSTAARGEGSITIGLTPGHAVYGQRFTTIPAAVNNSITLPIAVNATSTSIIFSPIDDQLFIGNFEVLFSITTVSGVIQKGNLSELPILVAENEPLSVATFATETETLAEEDTDGIPIQIALSIPASGVGTVSVSFTSTDDASAHYGRDFVTIPPALGKTVTLPVALHDQSVSFTVLSIDNSTCDYRSTTMSITSASGAIFTDESTTGTLTIKDDDVSVVAFEDTNASILENNASGIGVRLNFSKPAPENATLFIAGPTYVGEELLYRTLYLTDPPMDWDFYDLYLSLPVQKGETSVDFTIKPLNNNSDNAEPVLAFRLWFSSNYCYVANGEYILTIKDDD